MEALKSTGQMFDLECPDILEKEDGKKEEMKKTFFSWLSAIRGVKGKDDDTLVPATSSSDIPIPVSIPASSTETTPVVTTPHVESSFKEDDASTVEMSNVYPESTQKVVYEPIKRPVAAFAMSFSQKI